jgi:hypothetical protein
LPRSRKEAMVRRYELSKEQYELIEDLLARFFLRELFAFSNPYISAKYETVSADKLI